MKQQDLIGKLALVTGAASGMGRCVALDLAKEGVNLILVDIDSEALGTVAREADTLGAKAHAFTVDLTDWNQVKNMADTINTRWGAIDILVNCAGIAHMAHMVDTTVEHWDRLLGINLYSIIHTVNAFAPAMMEKKSGNIVNIASGQAFFAVPTWGAYATTKYAVDGFSEALRYELYWDGIQVSCVFPGIVKTPFYESITGTLMMKVSMFLLMSFAAKPETLSRLIVNGIKKNKKVVLQWFVWPAYVLKRVLPWPYDLVGRIGAWFLRREKGVCLGGSAPTLPKD